MAASANLYFTLIVLLVCRAFAAPISPGPICSSGQLIAPGQGSLLYKYKTEVKISVANGQYDLQNQITADVHIKSLGDCNYALQLRNVKVTETQDEDETTVTSTANAQRELENLVVRFSWTDGFVHAVEADSSAKVDHVNFIKGIISALQVRSPVPNDGKDLVREEDVLGVCTTYYKYAQKDGGTQITKNKDLATCAKDKLHMSSSPVLTSLIGPLIEEAFTAKTRYVCQTMIRDKKVQSVNCKTIELDFEDARKPGQKSAPSDHDDDSSSEENINVDFNAKDDEEISTKLVLVKQELKLQTNAGMNVDGNAIRNPIRQTLQFVATASFHKATETVAALISKIQALTKSKEWNQFAAARFVELIKELRRMDKNNIDAFRANSDLKHLRDTFLGAIYSNGPTSSLVNLDTNTLKFANPLSVLYLDKPSTELVDQIVQSASRLTAAQVSEFVPVAATILKKYKAEHQNDKHAETKIKEFQRAISKFLNNPTKANSNVTTSVLAAYVQLGFYDDQVQRLAANDQASLEVQYNALNAIRHICSDNIDENKQLEIRKSLQTTLLKKLQNKANKNAVRVWAFEALYTPFIYNPEEDDSTLADALEKALSDIVNEPLNQVNGFIWSVLKYSSLDRLCPLRGLAARLRAHHPNAKQFSQQATLSSRQLQIELPLRQNYEAVIHLCVVFENDRVVPSFIGAKLAFDGVRRETLRLPWVDVALVIENLDWNFADYFSRLDPLNDKKPMDEDGKTQVKKSLPGKVKQLQDTYDDKEEDPDPSVFLYMKLFGADVSSRDITDKVQDILRTNLRTFIRNQMSNRMKEVLGENPLFRMPLEIGAAVAAANGLTLYKSAQLAVLADLTTKLVDVHDSAGMGTYSINSQSALSFSLTLQREVASPLTNIGETIQIGALSNIPFEYRTESSNEGRIREFNLLNSESTLLALDFQYSLRTSKGTEVIENPKTSTVEPSCTPSMGHRVLGLRACLGLNPFRSIQLGSRPTYPITITVSKDPSVKKWRIGWRFNAKDAPQYEVAVEKVGTTNTYPGLGIAATQNGNNFDIKVLTGMKLFNVKGARNGNQFTGTVYSSDNKQVMTTSGTLMINTDGFRLDSKLFDISSRREVLALKTDIFSNRGQGLTADIGLRTPDRAKSFNIHFRGDLYKPDSKLFHISGNFTLGDVNYNGKAHLERNNDHTLIELHRSIKLNRNSPSSGHDFFYERKNNRASTQNKYTIVSHLTLQTPATPSSVRVLDFKTDFTRTSDLSNATLHGKLDFILLTRSPPVQESIGFDYVRRSIKTASQGRRLVSPEANLKVQLTTKSNVFNVLLDHRHRRSSEASKKGPETLPPTLQVANKIHIVADTDKLLPDIPRPFAFDILSDLDFELLNKIDYKFQYDLRRRQRSGLFTYHSQVDKVVDGHLFSGTSKSELQWDNKEKRATSTGAFTVCTKMRTLKTHWDIDTNLVPDKNDMQLDLFARFDRQPKANAHKSMIGTYNLTIRAPKHETFQLIDLDGNITRQTGSFETYNSIAYRVNKNLQEINLNVVVDRNQTGDGSLQSHVAVSLPLKNLPYITHDLILQRSAVDGKINHAATQLIAKPVFAYYGHVDIDRSRANQPPAVRVGNEIEYLRSNGDNLHGMSKVDVQRWSTLHSFGLLKRNTQLLHKHSIGYIFNNKTRKVALSLESPQLHGNPLSIIGELTIDRENRIGKMNLPQEVGVHLEFGTPLSNLTALHAFYNLPMFHQDDDQSVDAAIGFKIASAKITPISFYFHSEGSLNTTLHMTESLHVGDDIALGSQLTATYNPQTLSQISMSTSSKFYDKEFQNSFYALFKQHQMTVRGVLNATDNDDYKYEMDLGYDDDSLTGKTERTDGQQTIVSDIDAKKCAATGKYYRCYRGDITIRAGNTGAGRKGSFDVSYGRGTAKLDVRVADHISLQVDHTHSGHIRDDDFNSKTTIEGKSFTTANRGSFSYAGSIAKEDGKWNDIQVKSSLTDKNGQKSLSSDMRLNQQITNKLSGQSRRKIDVNLEQKGYPVIVWSSESNSCANNSSNVIHGICQTTTFNIKASNQLAERLRRRLELPVDPRLSNPAGQVTYDGTLKYDLKHDPKSGPHTMSLDLNRLREDAVDLDVTYQPRNDDQPMNIKVKAQLPRQSPMSATYDETLRSKTNFKGVLKYSFNTNEKAAEKTYQCDVDRPSADDVSVNCKGERTTLTIDIDRKAGKSKVYADLNKYPGQRIGYEGVRNPQTNEVDATIYTLVSSWNIKRQPGKSTIVTVKQKDQEVLRVEGSKVNDREIQIRFSPSGVNLKLEWDNSTIITLKQTSPQQRNLVSITIDRAQIRPYLPSLRNQNRPSQDIEEPLSKSRKPLVEIALDSHILLSLSQALDKLGSHNGRFGLDTIKKLYSLQIGDAPLTVYNSQHWKTHQEYSHLPESYSVRIVNKNNGNFVQLATKKWDEGRLVSEISHSFDSGRTLTSDLELDRNYRYKVGQTYFLHSLGRRNIEGGRQLRNFTETFVRTHLMKDLNKTNLAELIQDFRRRLRSVVEVDYNALKTIVAAWNNEADKSFLRQAANRLGLVEFFNKYPNFGQAFDRISDILRQRAMERQQFWRDRIYTIVNDNRLKELADRVQTRRTELIKRLADRADKLLDRFLPKVDQTNVDRRIAEYVTKLVTGFERVSKQGTEQWKGIFRAIDDASKGEENRWFRVLVADIDSNAFATAADAESAKVFKKLTESSKLLISNIQQISRSMTKRRENIRERIKNGIQNLPKAYVNDTNFELLVPLGSQPGSYSATSETMLSIGSLIRNRDQAVDTIRSIIQVRLEARTETMKNYFKAIRTLGKRLFKRNPSPAPEFTAVIARSGDAIDVHGDYFYLNPACAYIVAHDFANLRFSYRFSNGKIYSLIPNEVEIKDYECSNMTNRVQVCNQGDYYTLNIPMYLGGQVDGAVGDVRDRTDKKEHTNPSRWLIRDCPAAGRDRERKSGTPILECANDHEHKREFCENYVQNGLTNGGDRRRLIVQAQEAQHKAT